MTTGPVAHRRPFLGRVTAYDADRGLGTVAGDECGELSFHATAIADGSRQIDVGAEVCFVVRPGHRGQLEATGLVERPPAR